MIMLRNFDLRWNSTSFNFHTSKRFPQFVECCIHSSYFEPVPQSPHQIVIHFHSSKPSPRFHLIHPLYHVKCSYPFSHSFSYSNSPRSNL